MNKLFFTLTLSALSLTAVSSLAGECPVTDFDAVKIQTAIESSSSCYVASDIAESCAAGSSLDVQFVGAAITICEKGLTFSKEEKAVYDGLNSKCFAQYNEEEGSMSRSAASFCALTVTKGFAAALAKD